MKKIKNKYNQNTSMDSTMIAAQLLMRQSAINKSWTKRNMRKKEEKFVLKQQNVENLKEKLKLMYAVGINHMASHAVR